MMRLPPTPVFLARSTYRQRRMRDVLRSLPVVGAVLMALPLMWPGSGPDAISLSHVLIYLFALWAVMILATFVVVRWLRPDPSPADDAPPPVDGAV